MDYIPNLAIVGVIYCILLPVTHTSESVAFGKSGDSRTRNKITYRLPGEQCDPNDFKWYALEEDPRKFLYCDRRTTKLMADMCASVNSVPKIFDERVQRCVMPALGKQRTAGLPRSSGFGEPCLQNIDCLDNMYCPTGTCQCVAGYIDDRGTACVRAVAPDEAGCSSDRQCHAYWPTTACEQNVCKCKLPSEFPTSGFQAIAIQTAEGTVCIIEAGATPATTSYCPLPIPFYNTGTANVSVPEGNNTAFPNTVPGVVQCTTNLPTPIELADMAICVNTTKQSVTPIVCPNRAFTCMQPKPIGATTGELRHWYNQATGSCELFMWDGTVALANNFKTQEHCLSYCGGICRRGYTEVTNGGIAEVCRTTTCTGPNKQCQNVASAGRQLCCQTRSFICSDSGGRTLQLTATNPFTGIDTTITPKVTYSRWRYDQTQSQCTQFQYTGWGGNYNNFAAQQDCQAFCISAVCEQGQPLKDANGQNQACGRGCPSTYECRSNICCPKKQTVCVQPKRPGTCTQSIIAYWYNAATRDCEQFTYTGCGGNDNNFESYQACMTFCREVKPEPQCIQGMADKDSAGNYYTCSVSGAVSTCRTNYECYFDGFSFGCCPQRAYTCSLPAQLGTACVSSTSRWYYDTTTKSCQTFTYSGCDGNSNNFINRQECDRYCGVGGCPFGGEPYKEASGAIRVCNAQTTCPTGFACNTVGIAGNTVNYCCQTRAQICQQAPIQGTACGAQLQRYYFNMATKQCTTYTYFGCGGNENNFATLSQCNNFCGSAACLAGEAAYMDPNANRPLSCNPLLTNSCPKGYSCRTNTLNNTNVCCGSSDMGLCPLGEKAYVEALTGTVRECQPSVVASCPNNYLCRPNSRTGRYYCCATAAANLCPAGKGVYRSLDTNQPLACFVSTVNTCPQDYSCQPTTAGQTQGYCCSLNALCPSGGDFYLDPINQQPRQCIIQTGFNPCPTSYTCQNNNPLTPTSGYCCKGGSGGICPIGQPLMEGSILRQCVPNQPPLCPTGYSCVPPVGGGNIYYCCSTTGAQDGCPMGTIAFIPVGSASAQICTGPTDATCPSGYTCQMSPTLNRYQCCGIAAQTDGCPAGMVAFREPGSVVARACSLGGTQCPAPYSCQTSTGGKLQCCGLTGGCPTPNVAAINPSTGQPLACTSQAGCPSGFQCLLATMGQMTCCGTGTVAAVMVATCPFPGQTPYAEPGTGQPRTCQIGMAGTCPIGYDCLNGGGGFICCSTRGQGNISSQCWGTCTPGVVDTCIRGYRCQAVGGKYSCCRTGGGISVQPQTATLGECPSGSKPFTYPGTQAALLCRRTENDAGRGTCPVGYQCTKSTGGRNVCCRTTSTRRGGK